MRKGEEAVEKLRKEMPSLLTQKLQAGERHGGDGQSSTRMNMCRTPSRGACAAAPWTCGRRRRRECWRFRRGAAGVGEERRPGNVQPGSGLLAIGRDGFGSCGCCLCQPAHADRGGNQRPAAHPRRVGRRRDGWSSGVFVAATTRIRPRPRMDDPQRYLDPVALAKVRNLELQARLIVEGYLSGHAQKPLPRLLRRVRPAPRVRRPATTSSTSTGRSTAAPAASTSSSTRKKRTSPAGCSWMPASRCSYGSGPTRPDGRPLVTQVRLRLHVGRRPGLPDPAPAGLGRPGHVRQPGAPVAQAVEPAVAS